MRRATSGASIGPLSKQLTPILSVAAHEGPYAFKFKGLTLWLVKTPCLKLLGAFWGTAPSRSACAVLEVAAAACGSRPPPAVLHQAARPAVLLREREGAPVQGGRCGKFDAAARRGAPR